MLAMTDKQLRKLKRPDLIEILYQLRTELDQVRSENEKLRKKLDVITVEALKTAYGSHIGELLEQIDSEDENKQKEQGEADAKE